MILLMCKSKWLFALAGPEGSLSCDFSDPDICGYKDVTEYTQVWSRVQLKELGKYVHTTSKGAYLTAGPMYKVHFDGMIIDTYALLSSYLMLTSSVTFDMEQYVTNFLCMSFILLHIDKGHLSE